MKFYVHFASIEPRFDKIIPVIKSIFDQSVSIEKLIITTSLKDKRFTSLDKLNIYKNNNIIIQTLEEDYGPNNKILGALKYYESLEDKNDVYILICDDDNLLHKDTVKSYLESLENDKTYIYTHFKTEERIKNINHMQGADTYILNQDFLNMTTYNIYEEYLKKVIGDCPHAKYQDDYVICYFIYKHCNLKIKRVDKFYLYNSTIKVDQLHTEPDLNEKEQQTILYFKDK
jgi:hypothetical protein